MQSKNHAVILAAGKGTRMKKEINKMYLPLMDRPVIAHTLDAFYQSQMIDGIILVVAPGEKDLIRDKILNIYPPEKSLGIVVGGAERQDSVYNGLKALPSDTDIVAIHDGARPLIRPDIIDESIRQAKKHGGAVAGMPVKDTIKEVGQDREVKNTLDRSKLWLVQTPQTFKYPLVMDAYKKAYEEGYSATDDSSLVEKLGNRVYMIEGGYDNLKITTIEDIIIAEKLISVDYGIE